MPLSITGVPLHTRSLTIVASLGEDRRWKVRGDVIDLRKCGFVPMTQDIQPSGIIHHMVLELDVDPRTLRLESIKTDQPHVAVEPSDRTGGDCCRDPVDRLQALTGEILDHAFAKKLSANFGGALGCSHMLTLFFAMAAVLPRAISREREIEARSDEPRVPGERLFWRSIFIDGYEADDEEIELSVQLADVHSAPHHSVESPLERLERHEEARIVARVAPPAFKVMDLRAAERIRVRPNLADAQWIDRSERLASLIGNPVIPGLSRKARDLLEGDEELALVRDALLQLAPGHIQVLAAITERWFTRARPEPRPPSKPESESRSGNRPPVGAIGGMVDSCYMWRAEGPLIAERERAYQKSQRQTEAEAASE